MQRNTSAMPSTDNSFYLGIDIGSVSLNTVILGSGFIVLEEYYDYTHGKPYQILHERLRDIFSRIDPGRFALIAYTGAGGKAASGLTGGIFINEIIAQSVAAGNLFPEARTVIEIGGEDSKLIRLEPDPGNGHARLADFEMNSICAAGTGSFLDQQARRMGISIREEFGQLALKSLHPPRIAGRCSVFAKSDMIHLQQIATPVHDIVAGLCFALARNFWSTIGRSKPMQKPIVFSGGVAANAGMVRAFREILQLETPELIVPQHYASMGAIGAVYHAVASGSKNVSYMGLSVLEDYLRSGSKQDNVLEPLRKSSAVLIKDIQKLSPGDSKTEVFLGLDIGSLSTNVVLIDKDHRLVARRYLPTAGRPLDAIQTALSEIFDEAGELVTVIGAGTTGSGRYLTGDFIGADTIQNEITAQATAAIDFDPTVETIFEIGGQDSKYISIENGVVVDFEMNKVCAAGTGSFLEEQAEKLNINIVREFAEKALKAECPVKLGDRCTVFMESDLNTCMQRGAQVDNLVGGLAYSIACNYLQKVVGERKIGKKIFFQGGVTNNDAVVAAFEQILGQPIIVPPHFDVTGAIGAAILAQRNMQPGQKTRFKGFDIRKAAYANSIFVCDGCTNHCEIRKVKIEGETKPLFYGGRCEKYETSDRKRIPSSLPNLVKKREELLLNGFENREQAGKKSIGIPRALMIFYQQFPFWRTFFEELGFNVILSGPSDKKLVTRSLESISTETCLPVEIMHGHILDLQEQGVDYIFIPFIVNARNRSNNPTTNCNCPWIQSYPFMVKASLHGKIAEEKLLIPTLHFKFFGPTLNRELGLFMKERFGIAGSRTRHAIRIADEAQLIFERELIAIGKATLASIPEGVRPLVIMGRPYNISDPFLNLNLIGKLLEQQVLPVPLDFLELPVNDVFTDYRSMYWPNGQKILAAAQLVARSENLHAVYMSNFRCGPDSFLVHYVNEEMKGKPYLHLEVDEHSADAGLITRIEAFLDSLHGYAINEKKQLQPIRPRKGDAAPDPQRTLYFPYMNDSAHAISAAARSCGIPSEVLPMQSEEDLALGRKYTSSRECFPMICTTGSFLKKLMEPGTDPSRVSFFMPDHNGPCRFGQYNHFQRIIFDRLGFEKAQITTPSNDSSYADVSAEHAQKFRINAWKGFVVMDFLRKLHLETRPYELNPGETNLVYKACLDRIVACIEKGARGLPALMEDIASCFGRIQIDRSVRKPVVAVVGEIFMRDNAFCNGNIVNRLEDLGLEVLMAPFSEWIVYSTYRYTRDSIWNRDLSGYLKSRIQAFAQDLTHHQLLHRIEHLVDHDKDVPLDAMLRLCNTYVHKDYDGDPPIAMGTATYLAGRGISGIAAILPFTCMPGTLVASVSDLFRKDHGNIPWINIAYDGQDSVSLETRLNAFAHQVFGFGGGNRVIQPAAIRTPQAAEA
ncbi:MAG: acyl-CoA dehydratase activase [Bacteroidales bacterium]